MALYRELVRYATLAPSSHNTQCWRFRLAHSVISVLPDLSRRCPVVDPDDHHLYVSLGCAAENLVQAALADGYHCEVTVPSVSGDMIRIALHATPAVVSPLYQAIPERQCTRGVYDRHALSTVDLRLLEHAAAGPGVRMLLRTERAALETVLEYVVQGNAAQMRDAAFMSELKSWLRFSRTDALNTRDGLFAAASGNPVVPAWLGQLLLGVFFTEQRENGKCAKQLRSSAGIAVFVADVSDAAHWVNVGRCYERFAVQATALGIRNAMVNQPVEVAAIRPQFAEFLGVGRARPDLVVRFGRGEALPRSLRRSVESVVI